MGPQTITVPAVLPWSALAGAIGLSALACLLASSRPELLWLAIGAMLVVWSLFFLVARRASRLVLDADGLLFRGHRVGWDEITSIEPPSARGEIVLRLRRTVPDRLRLGREGSQDWLPLEGTSYAVGPLGLYALLVGTSHEASWLLGSADGE